MSTIFLSVLDMSLHGSVIVLAVLIMRLLLRKAPKGIMVMAWAVAAVRLLCPYVMTSVFSLMPALAHASQTEGVEVLTLTLPGEMLTLSALPSDGQGWLIQALTALWCVGVAAMLVYTVVAYRRTYHTLREAVPVKEHIYECDRIPTPFIFGLLRPRIYLPSSMDERDREYVVAHERAHLARFDHVWKPFGFAVLTLHWFNPLVWVAYVLFCRDMEMACDERVLGTLGADSKKPYADALINCAAPTRRIAACPLAFGETDVKARVRTVLRYRKPAWWLTTAAMLMCLLLCMCFLTDPKVQALERPDPTPPQSTTASTQETRPTAVDTMPTLLSYTQAMAIEAITPRAVRTGETVTVRVAVGDSRGIKGDVEILLYRESEDGTFAAVGEAVTMTLVQGTASDGVYEGTIPIPAGTASGDYRLRATYIPVSEKPAICTAYTPEGEAAVTIIE